MSQIARTGSNQSSKREDAAYFAKLMNAGPSAEDPIGQSIGFRGTEGGPKSSLDSNLITSMEAKNKNIPVYRSAAHPVIKGPVLINISE